MVIEPVEILCINTFTVNGNYIGYIFGMVTEPCRSIEHSIDIDSVTTLRQAQ
jgi:hypothetical protein